MKKLYNSSKGPNKRVHPSPSPLLSALPTALLALAAALSAEEQEVLAYLLGCEKSKEKQQQRKKAISNKNEAHPPELGCSCFGCYKSFWARWDSSPNRHVIHVIIDAFEETIESREAAGGKIKGKKQGKRSSKKRDDEALVEESMEVSAEKADDEHDGDDGGHDGYDDGYGDDDVYGDYEEEEEEEKSSVRRFVSWVFGINN